jgi:hypothetical protein
MDIEKKLYELDKELGITLIDTPKEDGSGFQGAYFKSLNIIALPGNLNQIDKNEHHGHELGHAYSGTECERGQLLWTTMRQENQADKFYVSLCIEDFLDCYDGFVEDINICTFFDIYHLNYRYLEYGRDQMKACIMRDYEGY